MVPKGQGKGRKPPGNRSRRGKAKTKGIPKAKGKAGRVKKPKSQAPGFIDPAYAILIKHPIRTQIVALGHQREISPSEFAEGWGLDLNFVSGHFRALRDADFLELVKKVKVRGTYRHMYRSTKRAYFTAADWGKLGDTIKDGTGAAVLQDINNAVAEAFETGTFFRRDDVVLFWLSLMADEASWPEAVEVLTWTIGEIERLAEETVNRHARGESKGGFPMTFAIAGFESPTDTARKKTQRQRKAKPKRAKQKQIKCKASASKDKAKDATGKAKWASKDKATEDKDGNDRGGKT